MDKTKEYAHNVTIQSNLFIRDKYRRIMKLNVMLGAVAIALVLVLSYVSLRTVPSKYYGSTTTGDQMPLSALSDPVLTEHLIVQWASTAVKQSYELNFSQDTEQLSSAKIYFTKSGWSAYQNALKKSQFLDVIKSDKLEVSSIVDNDPVVIKTGVEHGVRFWVLQMPVLVEFDSASATQNKNILVTIKVVRSSDLDALSGLQIESFSAT